MSQVQISRGKDGQVVSESRHPSHTRGGALSTHSQAETSIPPALGHVRPGQRKGEGAQPETAGQELWEERPWRVSLAPALGLELSTCTWPEAGVGVGSNFGAGWEGAGSAGKEPGRGTAPTWRTGCLGGLVGCGGGGPVGTQRRGRVAILGSHLSFTQTQLSLVQVLLRPREGWEGARCLHPIPEPEKASPTLPLGLDAPSSDLP